MANVKDSACRVGRAQSGEESPFYARLACRLIKNAPNALLSHLITREICKNTREVQHHSPAARTSRNSSCRVLKKFRVLISLNNVLLY